MAFSFVGSANGYSSSAAGTSWDCPTSLDIQEGDLLVAVFGWRGGALTNLLISDDDGTTNALTNLSETLSAFHGGRMAYRIAATASTGSIIRVSHTESVPYRRLLIFQFRPDAGETVSFIGDVASTQANTTAPLSNALSATGDDLLFIGGVTVYQARVMSAGVFDSVPADGELVNTYGSAFYKMYSSDQTDINAGCTLATAGNWIAMEMAFSSSGSGTDDLIADSISSDSSVGAPALSEAGSLTANSLVADTSTDSPLMRNYDPHGSKITGAEKVRRPIAGKSQVTLIGFTGGHGLRIDPYIIGEYVRNIAPSAVVDHLEASSISSFPSIDTPVIGQTHELIASSVGSSISVDNPIMGQEHILISLPVYSTSSVGNPSVGEMQELIANDIASISTTGTPILTTVIVLLANSIVSTSSVDAPILGQAHTLSANSVASASSTGAPVLGHRYAFTAVGVASTSSVGTPAPGQIHALAAVSVASPSHVGTPPLGQRHVLSANSIDSASTVGTPILSEAGTMVAVPIASDTFTGTPSLTQAHSLSATSIVALSSAGIPALLVIRNLLASPIVSGSSVGTPVAGQVHVLIGDSLYSVTTAGTPALDVGGNPLGKILVGGVWHEVRECHVLIAGSWRQANEMHVLVNGVWRTTVL